MELPPAPPHDSATTEGDYKVRLDVFEGPMDLLLHLIKVNEMDIYDIPISKITNQYMAYLRLMEQLDLEVAGDFLVMASTLINIKLRSLLPETTEIEEENEEVDDFITAQALMDKLVEYRKFKEAAAALRASEMMQSNTFIRDVALPKLTDAEGDSGLQMDLDLLIGAFSRVLRFVERRDWHLVTEEEYSVEEKMDWLEQRLLLDERVDIEEIFRACRSKIEMIVVLLAALELCHLRRVCVAQSEAYGSILIFPQKEGPQPVDEDAEAQFEPWPEPLPEEAGSDETAETGEDGAEGRGDADEDESDAWDDEDEDDDEDDDDWDDEEERLAEIVEIGGDAEGSGESKAGEDDGDPD